MRFTIRDLLLMTAIVAMGIGWGLDHAGQQRKARQAEAGARAARIRLWWVNGAIEELGYQVEPRWYIEEEIDRIPGPIITSGLGPSLVKSRDDSE